MLAGWTLSAVRRDKDFLELERFLLLLAKY